MTDPDFRRCFRRRLGSLVCLLVMAGPRESAATPRHDTPVLRTGKARQPPAAQLAAWASAQHARISWTVANEPEGRPIAEYDGSTSRNPASVSKLVTAYAALKILGPDFRFKTTIHGRIAGGSMTRLGIRGEGDPSLSSATMEGIAARLMALGLVQIDEDVVVDQTYFDDQYVPPAFDQQPNEWAAFRAPVCPTAVDRNRLLLNVVPSSLGNDARVFVEPFGTADVVGSIRTVERDTKGGHVQVKIASGTHRHVLRVAGDIGAAESPVSLERRSEDPRKLVGQTLLASLRARGVKASDRVSLGTVGSMPVLYTHRSEALPSLLYRLGKESDNFAAEMLLKTMGAQVGGEGSSASGVKAVSDLLARCGVLEPGTRLTNGSGLFDANRLSTNLLVRLLGIARADPSLAPEYLSQLSIAGVDGTLSRRFRGLLQECVIRAKTGTLRSVVSLAGYVERPDHRILTFAIIVEGVKNQATTRQQIDRYVASLCTLPIAQKMALVDMPESASGQATAPHRDVGLVCTATPWRSAALVATQVSAGWEPRLSWSFAASGHAILGGSAPDSTPCPLARGFPVRPRRQGPRQSS